MGMAKKWMTALLTGWLLAGAALVYGMTETDGDKTLSPYFWVQSDNPAIDPLPLKSTDVNVDISGVIADVVVTQVYENKGKMPLEAIYVFPASTRAAVYGMKMTIGERTITAQIKERSQARQDYEDAKNAGQSASLLEQQRPNVFQMNVANILPGDIITVELKYTELLIPTDAVYEFVYPAVVGPRYVDESEGKGGRTDSWTANPYLHPGELPKSTFHIVLRLNAGLDIGDIACPTHGVDISYTGKSTARIGLDPSDKYGGNRDFILKYRLAGKRIQSGLVLSQGDDENFFLMMLQPPKRVKPEEIPPREYVFIVDISGSMHGFPLDISKKLLKNLIGSLGRTDRFNVLLFAGSAHVMSPQSLPATPENVKKAIDVIENQRGGGGTRLLPALKKAIALEGTEGFSRTIVIATDGYVAVEEEAFDIIRNRLDEANMFAFGIGSSVNRHLIEGMARAGMGEPFVITRPEEAPEQAEKFRKLIASPVLTNIQVDYGNFDIYDVAPPAIPDVLADRPVIVFGKWRGKPGGTIRISGTSGNGPFFGSIKVNTVKPDPANAALKYLWARHRIAVLSDYIKLRPEDKRIQTVTHLGLAYNLLTRYTSFVAVDNAVRLENGKPVTVKQPLPLPRGVSDYAVGGNSGAFRAMASPPMFLGQRVLKEAITSSDKIELSAESEEKKGGIRIRDIDVSPGMLKNNIGKALRDQLSGMETCRKVCTGMPAEIKIELQVDANGHVVKVEFDRKALKNKKLTKCLTEILRQTPMPPLKDGRQYKILFILAW